MNGATLVFVDEAGFGLVPVTGKTWGLRGETPIIHHPWSPYARISVISGITADQRLFFQLKPDGTFKSPDIAKFLKHLLRHIEGEIVLVWDGAPQHRGAAIRQVLDENSRLEIVRLPGYSPDFNPDELVWHYTKNVNLRGKTPANIHELKENVCASFASLRRRPEMLRSFLHATELPWGSSLTG
ncbi:MAG: IS630 family transposase [Candidatus Thermoplasmatota archaeon]